MTDRPEVDVLAAALHYNVGVWGKPTPCEGWPDGCDTCLPAAAAILAALPEGWGLYRSDDDFWYAGVEHGTEQGIAMGAQQERERLRQRNIGGDHEDYGDWLLADPEDDR